MFTYYNNIKKNTAAFANKFKTQGIEFDYDNQLIYVYLSAPAMHAKGV